VHRELVVFKLRFFVTDVEELRDIALKEREEIARKVGHILVSASNDTDRQAALELAKSLVEDTSISVREVLSKELRDCAFLPKEIITAIAADIEAVSMPFLIASLAVDDDLLDEIIRNCGDVAQKAVATREGLSEALSFAITDIGCLGAVENLVDNETATVSGRSCHRVVDRFPEERSLMEKLAMRADLPAELVERIIFKISKEYGEHLTEKFGLSTDYASYLVSLANRQVFSKTLEVLPLPELTNYLQQLNTVKTLGSDLLLTYLQNGYIRLFTAAIATLLDKPYEAVEKSLALKDKKILAHILEAAGFSRSVIGVLLIAYERLLRDE